MITMLIEREKIMTTTAFIRNAIPFRRRDAKAFLDTMAHSAKESKKKNGGEGTSRHLVDNIEYGFTRAIYCYFDKKTRFYIEDCSYSRKELEDLLVDCYGY